MGGPCKEDMYIGLCEWQSTVEFGIGSSQLVQEIFSRYPFVLEHIDADDKRDVCGYDVDWKVKKQLGPTGCELEKSLSFFEHCHPT